MIKLTFPILFILLSIGLFFTYVDPKYKDIQNTLKEEEKYDQALDKSKELREIRDELLSKYNSFQTSDLDRLIKLLPDHVDNVRLILDIDHIASIYGMRIKDVSINKKEDSKDGIIGPDINPYQSVSLSFSVASTYDDLKQFIRDLERSLRIVDIVSIALAPSNVVTRNGALYSYNISLKTYWLKN